MSKFKVTYASGVVETTEQAECSTVEQFIMVKFGSVDPYENGAKIDMVTDGGIEAEITESEVESEPEIPVVATEVDSGDTANRPANGTENTLPSDSVKDESQGE